MKGLNRMNFPSRSVDKTRIESQKLNAIQKLQLIELSEEIEAVVKSDEFQELVELNRWNTTYGHCAVAVCALQVLVWIVYEIYVDTYHAVISEDCDNTHWFVCDPRSQIRLDPTKYQFDEYVEGAYELKLAYANGVRKGHPSRRRSGPYFTNSPPVRYIIDKVSSRLGFADRFQQ